MSWLDTWFVKLSASVGLGISYFAFEDALHYSRLVQAKSDTKVKRAYQDPEVMYDYNMTVFWGRNR